MHEKIQEISRRAKLGDITGATKQTYTVASADVGHTLRVVVTASNADEAQQFSSQARQVVQYLAEHTPAHFRELFLNLADVKQVMEESAFPI